MRQLRYRESLRNLLIVTQVVNDGGRIGTQAAWLQEPVLLTQALQMLNIDCVLVDTQVLPNSYSSVVSW